jgi:hypothetical protein
MAKVKIGVKYCGGCNPHYERVEMVQQVQSAVKGRFLLLRHDHQDLDGLIVVNGCLRACGIKDLKLREVPYYSIAEKGDVDNLMDWLFAFEQSGTKR